MEHQILINTDGSLEFIYTDELNDLLDEGKSTITRVSSVEPDGFSIGWTAKMTNGMKLGPYRLRRQALDAEIEYIKREML